MTAQGLKEVGRPSKRWEESLQENLRAVGAVPRKGAQRKWSVYDVEVNEAYDWVSQRQRTWVNGTWESRKEHKSLRMSRDARINEILTAVTDERQPPRGPPIEGLHLLVSVVDCLRGGSPAKPPGVRLYFICCLDSFAFLLFFPDFSSGLLLCFCICFVLFYGLTYYLICRYPRLFGIDIFSLFFSFSVSFLVRASIM